MVYEVKHWASLGSLLGLDQAMVVERDWRRVVGSDALGVDTTSPLKATPRCLEMVRDPSELRRHHSLGLAWQASRSLLVSSGTVD